MDCHAYSLTIEENALLKYGSRQYIATIKGIDENYAMVSNIDSSMWEGEFMLRSDKGRPYAIPGIGVAQYLGIRVNFITPLEIIFPKKIRKHNSECRKFIEQEIYFPFRNL